MRVRLEVNEYHLIRFLKAKCTSCGYNMSAIAQCCFVRNFQKIICIQCVAFQLITLIKIINLCMYGISIHACRVDPLNSFVYFESGD